MNFQRMWYSLRLCFIRSSNDRAEFLRKKQIFASIGENCAYKNRKIPLYPKLIRIGNNVRMSSTSFVTHNNIHMVINKMPDAVNSGATVQESIGCIEIGDNVFIGSDVTILGGVRIGSNVVIGAKSLVNKDIPDNSIAGGVPARVVGSFDKYVEKRLHEVPFPNGLKPKGGDVPPELAQWCWEEFDRRHAASQEKK